MNNEKVELYLKNLLTQVKGYSPSSSDQKAFKRDHADYIFRKLYRKKYRRKQMGEESKKALLVKVNNTVDNNQPIKLVIPFGGYKHFWNPSHPEPDWAELFHFRYITDLVAPILALYEPGVSVEYVSEDLIVPRMDNYPDEAIEAYMSKFKEILAWYQRQVPNNLIFKVTRVKDICNAEKLIAEVLEQIPDKRKKFEEISKQEKEIELKRSKRSIFWNGKLDLTDLSDTEKQEKIIESRLIELTFYDTEGKEEYIGNYYGDDNKICIVFSFGLSPDNAFDDLTLGTAHGSIAEYWIGRGVLENPQGPKPRIITAKQYEQVKDKVEKFNIDLGLNGKNYSEIEIVPKLIA